MRTFRPAALLAILALVALPPISADDPPSAPTLLGTYNQDTQGLTLSWVPDTPPPDGTWYTLYRNGSSIVHTHATNVTRDLSSFLEGYRSYTITVTYPGSPESQQGTPFLLTKNIVLPDSCPVASLSLYTQPPGYSYTVYNECIG